jgi:hypothetical protein
MKRTGHKDLCAFLSYLAQLFLECEMLRTQVGEKIKKYILC